MALQLLLSLPQAWEGRPLLHPFLSMTAVGTSHHVHRIDIVVAAVGIRGIVRQRDPLEAVDPAKLLRHSAPPADHQSLACPRPGSKEKTPPSCCALDLPGRLAKAVAPLLTAVASAEGAYPFLGLQGPALEVAGQRIPLRAEACRPRSSRGRIRPAPAVSHRMAACPL